MQDGEAIVNLDASFHADEDGESFQVASPTDGVPGPDELEPEEPEQVAHRRAFDRREVDPPPMGSTRAMWVRARSALPDDTILHSCVLTYMSDSGPVSAARRAVGGGGRWGWDGLELMTASLDHTMWFHQPVRADAWLLYDLHAVAGGRARGLSRGAMWTTDGQLAVSVTQEALLRRRRTS